MVRTLLVCLSVLLSHAAQGEEVVWAPDIKHGDQYLRVVNKSGGFGVHFDPNRCYQHVTAASISHSQRAVVTINTWELRKDLVRGSCEPSGWINPHSIRHYLMRVFRRITQRADGGSLDLEIWTDGSQNYAVYLTDVRPVRE